MHFVINVVLKNYKKLDLPKQVYHRRISYKECIEYQCNLYFTILSRSGDQLKMTSYCKKSSENYNIFMVNQNDTRMCT